MVMFNGFEVWTEGDSFLVVFHTPEDASSWCMAVQQVTCLHTLLIARPQMSFVRQNTLDGTEQSAATAATRNMTSACETLRS